MEARSASGSRWSKTAMLGVAIVVLLVIVVLSYSQWRHYLRVSADAEVSRDIVATSGRVLSGVTDAETGQRGFLLTGDESYLQPYTEAVRTLPHELADLKLVLASRPGGDRDFAQLDELVTAKLGELRLTIEVRRTQGAAPALAIVRSNNGKSTMKDIRSLCAQIERRELSNESRSSTVGGIAAGTALLVTTGGALVLLFLFAFGLQPFASPEPQAWQRHWSARYGAAVLAVLAIALLRGVLTPLIGATNMPFTLFFSAVAFAAWFGGFGPAALSIALSLPIGAFFFRRSDWVAVGEWA